MGELARKLENDRRSKDSIKSNAKSRFLTKEFSQPVMSFNNMVVRVKTYSIEKASREYKLFRFHQDREIDDITHFKQSLIYKSLNFSAEEFHESFERNRRTPCFPDVSGIRKTLRSLPTNTALDFPTALRPPSRKAFRIDSGGKTSAIRRKNRPVTSIPNSSRPYKFGSKQPRPATTQTRRSSSVDLFQRSPRQQLSRPESVKGTAFEEAAIIEQNGQGSKSSCKSYRYLKDKFTAKDTDTPNIDTKAHRLKKLKMIENINAGVIDKKVKTFIAENLPGENRRFEDLMQIVVK